jgi:hypothetical protein
VNEVPSNLAAGKEVFAAAEAALPAMDLPSGEVELTIALRRDLNEVWGLTTTTRHLYGVSRDFTSLSVADDQWPNKRVSHASGGVLPRESVEADPAKRLMLHSIVRSRFQGEPRTEKTDGIKIWITPVVE